MNFKKAIKTLTISIIVAATSLPMSAQDKLAKMAPVDRKLKVLDTLALQSVLEREQMEMPASALYQDWDNRTTHYKSSALPESFNINLRGYRMPTPSRVITSQFGPRWGRQHKGLDIKVYIGDTIRAAWSGKVRVVKYEGKGYGNYVVIRHSNGLETYYAHMSKHLVKENQYVRAGDPIGLGGNTGRSTGSHLHFETRLCGVALNPALFFDFRNQDITGDTYHFRRSTMQQEDLKATAARGRKQNGYTAEEVTGKKEVTARTEQTAPVTANATTESRASTRYHKVEQGETVYSIARKYGISVESLVKMNHIGESMRVRVGQLLRYS